MRHGHGLRIRPLALALALLGHLPLIVLLGLGNRPPKPQAAQELQFVSLWVDVPVPMEARPLPESPGAPALAAPPALALPDPSELVDAPSVTPSPSPSENPPVDWYGEAQAAARRLNDAGGQAGHNPPSPLTREACKTPLARWTPQEKRAGLLPLPYVRVGKCIVGLGFFGCTFGEPPAMDEQILKDFTDGERMASTVPDPNICG